MKFTVDIEEFYLEGGEETEVSIAKELHKGIVRDVVYQIREQIKTLVNTTIEAEARNQIINTMVPTIQLTMEEFIKTGIVRGRYSTDPPRTYAQFLEDSVVNSNPWRTMEAYIKSLVHTQAEKLSKEFKERYDVAFATKLVMRLGEQGMLKDNVAELLLKQ